LLCFVFDGLCTYLRQLREAPSYSYRLFYFYQGSPVA
jgi:hypothetical protein